MKSLDEQLKNNRQDYNKFSLDQAELSENPFREFEKWLNLAFSEGVHEPIAMTLSTVNADCRPSSRIVLLRGFNENGFVFYTNYESRKGNNIRDNNWAAINFYWYKLDKQIRIEGRVDRIADKLSDEYFNSRPRESQLGAWASEQSKIIGNRSEFEDKLKELDLYYKNKPVPRPPHWGGYCLKPVMFEFWQGRPSRLHDRFQFILESTNWKIQRLAP